MGSVVRSSQCLFLSIFIYYVVMQNLQVIIWNPFIVAQLYRTCSGLVRGVTVNLNHHLLVAQGITKGYMLLLPGDHEKAGMFQSEWTTGCSGLFLSVKVEHILCLISVFCIHSLCFLINTLSLYSGLSVDSLSRFWFHHPPGFSAVKITGMRP